MGAGESIHRQHTIREHKDLSHKLHKMKKEQKKQINITINIHKHDMQPQITRF